MVGSTLHILSNIPPGNSYVSNGDFLSYKKQQQKNNKQTNKKKTQ